MEKTVAEQERELRDLIRRAKGQSNKTGNMRRDTLTRLISPTQSMQPASLKILAADGIQYLFKDFPDLEERSINAVYDLCEDQSPMVRIEGYKALAHMSRAQPKWVKRNADVLLQLLQSDEPDEVTVVKQSLLEHLELDPRITLSVLCDQIMPLEASSDEEEKGIRDRLRVLVLSFLADEAKDAISRRVTSGSEAEEVLVGELLAAIPKLPPSDVAKIVKEILLLLQTYSTPSQQGKTLLRVLLDLARDSLRKAIRGSASRQAISFEDTQCYLQLAHILAVERSAAPATDLLAFYLTSLASKMTLQRLSPSDQVLAIGQLADAFLASGRDDTSVGLVTEEETTKVRRQAVDACPVLFERLVDIGIVNSRTMGVCITLLTECVRVTQQEYFVVNPSTLRNCACAFNEIAVLCRRQH
ncbi:hypothetical protein EYR40_006216 [Pleurotus pulmonarius]|nr:hypothetical protein EYR40_006216 [Pleurotus pulmonarius]